MNIGTLSLDKALLFLYLITKPFYLFDSGNPQIADFIMIILMIVTVFSKSIAVEKKHVLFIFAGSLFVYYILMVNGIWSIILGGEMEVFKSSLWYGYNFAVSLVILILFQRNIKEYAALIYYSICFSMCIQLIILLGNLAPANDGLRHVLFFNNPNQLGYYGLLCLAFITYIPQSIKVNRTSFIIALVGAFSLIAISLSKAALVSSILMYLFFLFVSKQKQKALVWSNLILLVVSLLFVFIFYIYTQDNLFDDSIAYEHIKERILEIGSDDDDSLSGRGYDRIVNDAQYIILGAGEGDYTRFNSVLKLELHSTLANIFFSYGIIGTLLFAFFVYVVIKKHGLIEIYPLGFLFLYGLTHNGIRETYLWIFFTLIFIVSNDQETFKVHGQRLASMRGGMKDEKDTTNLCY